ncbi:hypothetical protein [Nonomuraea rhizosphaerae]|uniref:hypothetical protein n=1 Tax=Nonomuraea rhizosphaerae TaxID=2665663 RepID=UPI001C5F9606|nr:hypothetical protein [Nonomuraea rhizosphaerae]
MLLALAAVAMIGLSAWWLGRRAPTGEPVVQPLRTGWRGRLGEEAATALLEGLRALPDQGGPVGPVGIDERAGVVTVADPPCLVSLDLLANLFAARGQAALYDPQATAADLMTRLTAAERPGVLRPRTGWTDGDGFAQAVRKVVCPEGAAAGDERLGALVVVVLDTTMLLDLGGIRERFEDSRARQPGAPDEVVLRSVLSSVIADGGPGLTWTAPPTERQLSGALAIVAPPVPAKG